ncbi:MAG: tRNA (guanine(46)-N(7))-methyltransferase TrmB, partial [Sphingomonadaceae bacterium]
MLPEESTQRRLHGRRKGHALRQGQAERVERLLPALAVPADGPLDAHRLFGDERPLWLEVGFGGGEHLAFQAQRHPQVGLIGCEPFLNGVASLLRHVEEQGLANVRVHMGDALDVLERLPPASLERLFLLHPDPWPKARHAARRFVNPGPMALVASRLRPGGELRIATDHPTYVRWALMVMRGRPEFRWTARTPADWQDIPGDWPDTRFARKARALGHEVWRLRFERV